MRKQFADKTNDNVDTTPKNAERFSIVDMLSSKKGQWIVIITAVVIMLAVVSMIGLGKPSANDELKDLSAIAVGGATQITPVPEDLIQGGGTDSTVAPTITDGGTIEGSIGAEVYRDGSNGETVDVNKVTITAMPEPDPTIEPVPFVGCIKYGEDNDAISAVQSRYMALNYMDYDEPTKHFGPATQDATRMFQRRNGLEITGTVDEPTYRLLMSPEAKIYMVALGDDGDDVQQLQERLFEMGYLKAAPTGHFGTDTYDAILLFQTNNDLTVDGMIGERTRELLYSSEAVPNMWTAGDSSDGVKTYQKKLRSLGYMTTEPDGRYGSDTVAAVKRFQDRNSLISDGYLGPKTMKTLMSKDAIPNSLAMGARGDDVESMQKELRRLKYVTQDMVTGYFGSATDYAVRAFQRANDLKADGRVGKETMQLLTSSNAKRAPKGYKMYTSPSNNDGGNSGGNSGGNTGGNTGHDSNTPPSVAEIIRVAKSRLGCRYVRGGKGPTVFDCSGFVFWCLNEVGIRQSYLTSYSWRSVTRYQRVNDIDKLQAGDVIVFYGHVGLIISDTEMIDASSSSGKIVRRDYLGSWSRREFICGYRIFD